MVGRVGMIVWVADEVESRICSLDRAALALYRDHDLGGAHMLIQDMHIMRAASDQS